MYDRRPDVTDEDLGIRAFQLKKAKAAERAIERLRHGMGERWRDLKDSEIEEIEWVLGELWAYLPRDQWDGLAFGHLNIGHLVRIMTLGSELRRNARPSTDILRDVEGVVRGGATETASP